jgi:hypothetical protein
MLERTLTVKIIAASHKTQDRIREKAQEEPRRKRQLSAETVMAVAKSSYRSILKKSKLSRSSLPGLSSSSGPSDTAPRARFSDEVERHYYPGEYTEPDRESRMHELLF